MWNHVFLIRMAVIFLDESGQFTKHGGEKYFVVGSFTVGEPRRAAKRFRAWCRSKFPRVMRDQPEVKFSKADMSGRLRLQTVEFIANLDIRVNYAYLLRENIPTEYWKQKQIQSGLLYTHIIGEVLEMYLPVSQEMRAFCDRRSLFGLTTSQFQTELVSRLLPQVPHGTLLQVAMVDSGTHPNIQIADWVTGALAAYLNEKPMGENFYRILKNNIFGSGKELFKNYWEERFDKQKTQSKD